MLRFWALTAGCLAVVVLGGRPERILATSLATDLVQPLDQASPRLRFHLGEVANNQPLISSTLPDIPGSPSPYYIAQWQQSHYIRPDILLRDDLATFDPKLGVARYGFEASDGHAHVWLYQSGQTWVYDLYEAGGTLRAGGGSNVFLSTDHFASGATLDKAVVVDFNAKLSKAAVDAPREAQMSGAVLAHAFAGFGLLFTGNAKDIPQFVFLQIPITASRPFTRAARAACVGEGALLYAPPLSHGERTLPFAPDLGALQHFHYRLNDYLSGLLSVQRCGSEGWPAAAHDPANWRVTGFYIGLETETSDERPTSKLAGPQGYAEEGMQIANLRITRD